MRFRGVVLFLLFASTVAAQYPNTRRTEVRIGQQRPHITALVNGPLGMIWLATDIGVVRTDGLRHDLILATEPATVTAIASGTDAVYAALSTGEIVRCKGSVVDTLQVDTLRRDAPVRSICDAGGTIWLGTQGMGVQLLKRDGAGHWSVIDTGINEKLPADQVNALCLLPDGRVAVATDQGIAICTENGVSFVLNEQDGVPDNLVMSLQMNEQGILVAGTDQMGWFTAQVEKDAVHITRVDTAWASGPVRCLAFSEGMIWVGTDAAGVHVQELPQGSHYAPAGPDGTARVLSMLAAPMGSVWWCDGTDVLRRADPHVLVMPVHEGVDMHGASAICSSKDGRIWIALGSKLYAHDHAFGDADRLKEYALPLQRSSTIVALEADATGNVWVGTMGQGVFHINAATGRIDHWSEQEGLVNNNVLAIERAGSRMVFGTLGGASFFDGSVFTNLQDPGSGFIYDVAEAGDGSVIFATDGSGLLRLAADGSTAYIAEPNGRTSTFYSLCTDDAGTVWACGPGTGLCRVQKERLVRMVAGRPPLDGEVYAIQAFKGSILVFGRSSSCAFDPRSGKSTDVGSDMGLRDLEMPLNAVCTDASGSIWLATSGGPVRLRPSPLMLSSKIPVVITDLRSGDAHIPMDTVLHLRPDQNFLTFQFAGLRFDAAEELRFQYRLIGFDTTVLATRDREVSYSRLPPGEYRFEVRAFLAGNIPDAAWTGLDFTVLEPWYKSAWALALFVLCSFAILFAFVRLRELRLRDRERMEKEKVRFQLEAVRSQVNPHFLFNSFNTLIELIEEDRENAVEHVQQLSDFFRNILQVRDKDLIPLEEELQLLDTYFLLEQRRFGERIRLVKEVSGKDLGLLIPPLTLQLLLENALKHNVATLEEPLVVLVRTEAGWLEVRNAFRERSGSVHSTGYGLHSIRQRYAALTDRAVEVGRSGTDFRVRIPLIQP